MNKKRMTSFLIGTLKHKMLLAILAVSLISAGGIFLSAQNNFLSNNSINNKTILAQNKTTGDTTAKTVTKNNENATTTSSSVVKVEEQATTTSSSVVKVEEQTTTTSSTAIKVQTQTTTSQTTTSKTTTSVNSVSSEPSSETVSSESSMKENYLNELSAINEEANKLINGNADETQYEIDESSLQVYNLWNNELNKIYSSLKTTLTTEEMAKLQSEEINWIVYKEQVAKEDAKEYSGGSIYSTVVNLKLANLTKERCYYLVNNYM